MRLQEGAPREEEDGNIFNISERGNWSFVGFVFFGGFCCCCCFRLGFFLRLK